MVIVYLKFGTHMMMRLLIIVDQQTQPTNNNKKKKYRNSIEIGRTSAVAALCSFLLLLLLSLFIR